MSPHSGPGRGRRAAAAVLAVVYVTALPAAITAGWIRGTVLSTSGYVAAVAPVAADPAVRAAINGMVSPVVSRAVESAAKSAMPSPAGFLAGPLGHGLGSLAGHGTDSFMSSPEFQRLWTAANGDAHRQLVSVLNGSSTVVATAHDQVVLNLAPLVSAVLKETSAQLSSLSGKTVTLPAISTVPAAACQQIAALTRTQLPATCGQFPLFPASALTGARRAFRVLCAGTTALPVIAPAAGAAALLAATRRRRALVLLGVGGALTLLVTCIVAAWLRSTLIARAQPRYQPAVSAIVHALTGGFFALALWCAIGSLVLAAAALLTIPRRYRWREGWNQEPVRDDPLPFPAWGCLSRARRPLPAARPVPAGRVR